MVDWVVINDDEAKAVTNTSQGDIGTVCRICGKFIPTVNGNPTICDGCAKKN